MWKYEEEKQERFKHRLADELEDYYFLDQSAERLSRSRINKILKEHCQKAGVSRLMGHFNSQITAKYLRGLEQHDILEIWNSCKVRDSPYLQMYFFHRFAMTGMNAL